MPHLEFNHDTHRLSWHKSDIAGQSENVADIFRFVNQQYQFLSALTSLQLLHVKKGADADSLRR
ncbi:hypothetical protein AFI02nite_41160 [Aliivibrio fischeri]|uniref:Uncharacterized protein n=1 Tax=Aliivibrio fischeri TaxID=668 RepID=A0A510US73_ALIFS|nr:hypothetical protein AFI02nite_41160 [Aliivibrio fischeri]